MDERHRKRRILGVTPSVCSHCDDGPMVVTRSRNTRRLRDLVNPWFDPEVVHREVCTVCTARVALTGDRLEQVLSGPRAIAGPEDEPGPQPKPAPEQQPGHAPEPEQVSRTGPADAAWTPVVVTPPLPILRRSPLGAGRRPGPRPSSSGRS